MRRVECAISVLPEKGLCMGLCEWETRWLANQSEVGRRERGNIISGAYTPPPGDVLHPQSETLTPIQSKVQIAVVKGAMPVICHV